MIPVIAALFFIAFKLTSQNRHLKYYFIPTLSFLISTVLFESTFEATHAGRLLNMACISQVENLLQRFTHLTKKTKFFFFLIKLLYFAGRLSFKLSETGETLIAFQDLMPILGIFITFTLTVHIDDQIICFISSAFRKIQETEQHWFTSLQKITNGILIYNTEEKEFTFKNQKLDGIFGLEEGGDSLDCMIKSVKKDEDKN